MQFDDTLRFATDLDSKGAQQGLSKLETYFVNTAANITSNIASKIGSAFAAIPQQVIQIGSAFESSMSQVAATMGITAATEEFELLSNAAKEMGEATKFSASQAGDALNYLALAGYDAEKAVAALPTVLDLAAAGGMDLAAASDMVTDSMSALGLETSEMESFTDKMAVTAQKTNTSVSQLGEAILTVGGTAKMLSGGVTEMNSVLGILADNGIKASEGGTALRNIITDIGGKTKPAREALAALGVSAYDAEGNMRPLKDTFGDLHTALEKLNNDQMRTQYLTDIFGAMDLKAVNALIDTTSDKFDKLAECIDNSAGAAADMAETMSDNLTGDITICQSAVEGLANVTYEKFNGTMREAVQAVTMDIGTLTDSMKNGELSDSVDKIAASLSDMARSAAALLADDVIPAMIKGFSEIVSHGNEIISVAAGMAAAFAAFKAINFLEPLIGQLGTAAMAVEMLTLESGKAAVAQMALSGSLSTTQIIAGVFTGQISLATAATIAFNAVLTALPFIGIAAAIGVFAGAVVALIGQINDMNKAIEETDKVIGSAESAYDKLNGTIEENNSVTKKNEDELKNKISIYEELRQKQDKTQKDEEQLIELTKEIQSLSPTTINFIDEETGAYLSLADSIDEVIAAMERKRQMDNANSQWNTAKDNLDSLYKQYDKLREEEADLYAQLENADPITAGKIHGKIAANKEAQNNILAAINENEAVVRDTEKEMRELYAGDDSKDNNAPTAAEAIYNAKTQEEQQTAERLKKEHEDAEEEKAEKQKENTEKLKSEWERLDHEYAVGNIKTEKDLYAQKLAVWQEYGDESLKEHWKYSEDLKSMETKLSDDEKKAAEKAAADRQKADEDAKAKQTADIKEKWQEISDAEELGDLTFEQAAEKRKEFLDTYKPDPKEFHQYYVKVKEDNEKLAADQKKLSEEEKARQIADMKEKWQEISNAEELGNLTLEQAAQKRKELIAAYHPDPKEFHQYYVKIKNDDEKLAAEEKQTAQDKWNNISRLENLGLITEEEGYRQRLEWIREYCPEYSDEWYDYYKEVYDYQVDFAKAALDERKEALNSELSAVQSSVSKIVSEYKSAYSDIESNMNNYKSKLMDVGGSVFSIEEKEEKDGTKTKTYKVADIKKSMETMKKFHEAVKKLKSEGAPQSLLSELLSLDGEDGLKMANYMLDSNDFEDIKKLYMERETLAAELSEDMYADDFKELNKNLVSGVTAEYDKLPPEMRDIGKNAIEELCAGIEEGMENLSELMENVADNITRGSKAMLDGMTPDIPDIQDIAGTGGSSSDGTAAGGISAGISSFVRKIYDLVTENQWRTAAEPTMAMVEGSGWFKGLADMLKNLKIPIVTETVLNLDGMFLTKTVNENNIILGRVTGT